MIKTYTNAGDAADSARSSALQAMVDARFGAADAARMEYLSAIIAKTKREVIHCACGRRINHVGEARSDKCFRCRRKKEIACPAT